MNAGELTVRVRAELSEFDGQMRDLETRAGNAGVAAAKQIDEKASKTSDIGNMIAKKFSGPMAFIGLAENLTDAINTANEEGFGAGLEKLVQSTPIIGTAYRLGTAIGNVIADAISDDDEIEEEMKKKLEESERRINRASQREKESKQQMTAIADQAIQTASLERKLGIENARAIGDEREVAYLEALDRVASMERERDIALGNATSDEEKERIRTNHNLRVELEQMSLDARFAQIQRREDEQAQRDKDAADKLLKDEERKQLDLQEKLMNKAKDDQKKKDDLAEQQRKNDIEFLENQLDAVADEMTDIEDRRKKAQTSGLGSVSTALGTFKFDAYPDSEKRKNDLEMVNALKDIAKRGLVLSEQRAALGFS